MGAWYSLFIENLAHYSSHYNFVLFIKIRPIIHLNYSFKYQFVLRSKYCLKYSHVLRFERVKRLRKKIYIFIAYILEGKVGIVGHFRKMFGNVGTEGKVGPI